MSNFLQKNSEILKTEFFHTALIALHKKKIEIIIILANIALAAIVIGDPIRAINTDGVLYLKTAQVYWVQGWNAALHLYPWPFYPALIAWIGNAFHWSLEQTAYGLNVFFQILICLGFFNLACEIKGISVENIKSRQEWLFLWLSAFVILFFPMLNQFRDLIVRDFGYWAFSLWAWFYLIQLGKTGNTLKGIQFALGMFLAGLFRPEGMFMLLVGPFALFGLRNKLFLERIKLFFKAYSMILVGCLVICVYLALYPHNLEKIALLDFKAPITSGINKITQILSQAKYNLATHVLTQISIDSASTLLFGGLIVLYAKTLITTLTPLYSFLVGICLWKKQFSPLAEAKPVLWMAIFLNAFVTLIFMLQSLFLANRYIFALCLLLLLWVPFGLLWIYKQQKSWIFLSSLLLIGVLGILAVYNFGPSKIYLKQAGNWMHDNALENVWIYTNSPQVYFYANRPLMVYENNIPINNLEASIKNAIHKKYRYLAFQVSQNNLQLRTYLNQQLSQPIKIFGNEKNDEVRIYEVY